MDLLAIIRIALRALARNKMRSVLTMLGIIIGVGAVIAMLGVGQGARQTMQEQIQAMGSNLLFVGAGTVTRSGMHLGWGSTKSLIYDDMLAILRECPAAHAAAPGSSSSGQVVFGNDNWATRLNGTEPQYFDIRSWAFMEGSAFTQDDVEMSANVAVVGETVRKNLFNCRSLRYVGAPRLGRRSDRSRNPSGAHHAGPRRDAHRPARVYGRRTDHRNGG